MQYPSRGGRKGILSHCSQCGSLLVPNEHPSELWAGLSVVVFLGAFATTFNYVEREYAVYIGLAIIFAYGAGLAWFYNVYLKQWKRWKRFKE